jgi:predicted nucleic acid-binding protein
MAKHIDQGWSFTDCVSFQAMKARRLREALTKDEHFEKAGFRALLRGDG